MKKASTWLTWLSAFNILIISFTESKTGQILLIIMTSIFIAAYFICWAIEELTEQLKDNVK